MDVNNVKTLDAATTGYASSPARPAAADTSTASATKDGNVAKTSFKEQEASAQDMYLEAAKNLTRTDVKNISQELNHFMELINADIRFKIHDGTKQLIVQVVDMQQQKVLKQFPPEELLDTMARIRDYVGVLLDKKA